MKITELAEQTTKEFTKVYERFSEVDTRFDRVDARFDHLEDRVALLETQMTTMKDEILEAVDQRMGRKLDHIISLLEGTTGRLGDHDQELTMAGGRLDRHERWIESLARHTDLTLES